MIDVSLQGVLHKALIAGTSALLVGAGAVVLNVSKDQAVNEQRLGVLERTIVKLDNIDANVRDVKARVDVMNQKLDDAKDALRIPK